ncbi:MAG TPA: ankyrin repeat domain-containing protein [Campylobacterales bacterium]|nr:ankyrin repeat domain-containing protein [Campylobacterales bacterium]
MTQPLGNYYHDIYLLAMVEQKIELSNTLLQQCDINLRDHQGRNALYWAIEHASEQNIHLLLRHNIDLFVQPKMHALFQAVLSGNRKIVGYILAQDVNINMRNTQGYTPLIVAIQSKNSAMVRYLLQYGADTTVACYQNKTVWDYALRSQSHEIMGLVR